MVIALGALTACSPGTYTPSINLVEAGECVIVSGPDDDVTVTEVPCQGHPGPEWKVDEVFVLEDTPCSHSESEVSNTKNPTQWPRYCLSLNDDSGEGL